MLNTVNVPRGTMAYQPQSLVHVEQWHTKRDKIMSKIGMTFTPKTIKAFTRNVTTNYKILIIACKETIKGGFNATEAAKEIKAVWGTCPDTSLVTRCHKLVTDKVTIDDIVRNLSVYRERRTDMANKKRIEQKAEKDKNKNKTSDKTSDKEQQQGDKIPAIALVELNVLLVLALECDTEGQLRKNITELIARFTPPAKPIKKTTTANKPHKPSDKATAKKVADNKKARKAKQAKLAKIG